jgi:hypothetical protein
LAGAFVLPVDGRPRHPRQEPEMFKHINWMKFAETMSSMNPYGPVIMADGSIYSPDGRLLAPATEPSDQPAA